MASSWAEARPPRAPRPSGIYRSFTMVEAPWPKTLQDREELIPRAYFLCSQGESLFISRGTYYASRSGCILYSRQTREYLFTMSVKWTLIYYALWNRCLLLTTMKQTLIHYHGFQRCLFVMLPEAHVHLLCSATRALISYALWYDLYYVYKVNVYPSHDEPCHASLPSRVNGACIFNMYSLHIPLHIKPLYIYAPQGITFSFSFGSLFYDSTRSRIEVPTLI